MDTVAGDGNIPVKQEKHWRAEIESLTEKQRETGKTYS